VTDISRSRVTVGTDMIDARTIIWAAGVHASPAGEWLGVATDMAGRVVVNSDFSVPGHARVFVLGDTGAFRSRDGKTLPAVAPAAKQAGSYVGRLIAARATGLRTPPPFAYADYGCMATIGRGDAVAQLGPFKLKRAIGWLVWSLAHIYFLIGFRNRFSVAVSWLWSYLTYQRGVRLITGLPTGTQFQMDEAA
jgi:NADH dehydrogenase